jgi:hypothetical protein
MRKTAWKLLLFIVVSGLSGQALGGFRDAPLPDDVFVTEPGPRVPDSIKPFAGKWTGNAYLGSVHLPHILVVERINHNVAWTVYSLGLSPYAGGPGAWYRIPMGVHDGELTAFPPLGWIKYRLVSNDELEFEGVRGAYKVKGKLKREAFPVQPFSSAEPPTYWPTGIEDLKPGDSASPVPAVFPENLNFEPAPEGVSPERDRWLGKWSGWACLAHGCDIKLAVLRVTASDSARVLHLYANKINRFDSGVRDAVFVGNELQIRFASGMRFTYRMRDSGVVEAFYLDQYGGMTWGVMTKEH